MVIDGEIAYLGGINLSDEYVNVISPLGHWKDAGVRLHGPAVRELTRLFFVSRSTVVRQFRKYMNTTPSSYVETRRLAEAKRMLERGESVQDTCERCGFPDYSHFIALFRRRFGITPYRYSRQEK